MRDLDRLQEQDPDGRGRHGVWLVLATLALALLGGVFVWNRTYKARLDEPDPLDRLAAAQPQREADRAGSGAKHTLDRTKLTFEQRLSGTEERPEVIAALEAARREEETLAAGEAEQDLETPAPKTARATPAPGQIPAGLTASSGDKLEKTARLDKLVAAALPKAHNAHTRASVGTDGEFILQVLSYTDKEEAESFASALRARGHEAFVAPGDVDGRERTYRVRIGPFQSKQTADAYRRRFEERERMNTLVVRGDE